MTYEIWETDSGNVVGGYDTEADALAVVCDTIAVYGEGAVTSWLLLREDRRGASTSVAQGVDLAAYALRSPHAPIRRTVRSVKPTA